MREIIRTALFCSAALVVAGFVVGTVAFIVHRTPPTEPVNCTYTYDDRHGVGSITVTWDDETCALIHKRAERR